MKLSVIILDNDEPTVVALTYQNLWKELKDMPDTELLVADNWLEAVKHSTATYYCFVEADCLVSSGYFKSQLGLFEKNRYFRKLAMLSASTAVNNWANRFFGYGIGSTYVDGVLPNREKKSTGVYPVQIGFVPGAIIRSTMLKRVLEDKKVLKLFTNNPDLVYLSTMLSLAFWRQGDGNRVHVNPNMTYVTTEQTVNEIGQFDPQAADLVATFRKESI